MLNRKVFEKVPLILVYCKSKVTTLLSQELLLWHSIIELNKARNFDIFVVSHGLFLILYYA